MLINGSCHCRNIRFLLRWDPDPREIPARACGCTFCVKHGGVWTSYPGASLKVVVADPARMSAYAFGTKTATFHVCRVCGVVPVVTSEIDGRVYAVVNVNTFEDVEASVIRHAAATFDGEREDARLARRKRNWIADVELVEAESDPRAAGVSGVP